MQGSKDKLMPLGSSERSSEILKHPRVILQGISGLLQSIFAASGSDQQVQIVDHPPMNNVEGAPRVIFTLRFFAKSCPAHWLL